MSTRSLGILAAATLVVVIAAIVSSTGRSYDTSTTERDPLFPDLRERINSVAAIEIRAADTTITLERRDEEWVDASRGGYPVRFEPVKQLLLALSDAEIIDHKTDDPEHFARLGVADPSAEAPGGTLVTLGDDAGQRVVSLLVGNLSPTGDARFVRPAGQNEVLLVGERLDIATDPARWLERQIMRIQRNEVERVTVAHPSGENYTIVRVEDEETGEQSYELLDVPPGRRVRAVSPLLRLAGALSYVDLQDVRPERELDVEKLDTPLLATFITDTGMEIDVTVWADEKEGRKWVGFDVHALEDAAPEGGEADDSLHSLQARVERLRERTEGWAFELTPAVLVPLETRLFEMTEPIPEPEPEGPQPQTPDAG